MATESARRKHHPFSGEQPSPRGEERKLQPSSELKLSDAAASPVHVLQRQLASRLTPAPADPQLAESLSPRQKLLIITAAAAGAWAVVVAFAYAIYAAARLVA